MSNNREKRIYKKNVHLFLALQRTGTAKDKKCIRQVIKDEELDLKILEAKCLAIGGEWRIHKTVNARNCEKARKLLLKMLIDHPEKASVVDSEWRTALMQRECRVDNYFMFDVDSTDYYDSVKFEEMLGDKGIAYLRKSDSPNGLHYITVKFDTRKICKLPFVTLLRDGYYYVKTVGENNDK